MVVMNEDKLILDPCCGSKMFWFDKNRPDVLYCDKRTEKHTLCDGRALEIQPDLEIDFTEMPFEDESFYHVIFDPPHMTSLGANSWMALKYGRLDKKNWQQIIGKGFSECMRVLKPNGTCAFKWNVSDVKLNELLKVLSDLGFSPLYGHTTGRQSKTIWLCFFKK
jgi:hypothetical protein